MVPQISGPLARVLLRYAGAALMTKAGIAIDVANPDMISLVEFLVGGILSATSETWWYFARKYGWCQ